MILNPQYLKYIALILKVKIEKINFNEELLCTCRINDKTISGIINIITHLLEESNSNLSGINLLEKAEVQQWIEYGIVYGVHIDNPHNLYIILNELNEVLSTKTYLVSYKLTIADILLYYILTSAMTSLSSTEKEKYMNVSRWFDNLQQDRYLRQSNMLINFNSNYLASMVSARY